MQVTGDGRSRVLRFQEQQLRRHQVRDVVVDRGAYENDAVFEQPRIDVVGALATIRLLDDHWDQRISFGSHQGLVYPSVTILEPVRRSVKREHELFLAANLKFSCFGSVLEFYPAPNRGKGSP